MNGGSTGDFSGSETVLYDTVMVDTCHHAFVKALRTYTTKSELQCKLWTLGNNNVSALVHQLGKKHHSDAGC